MTRMDPASRCRAFRWAGAVAAGLAAAVWLSQTWSPSSYAIVLRSLDARDAGLVVGTPRDVRSDEWSILTPLVQATVNNGFRRHNATSFYGEDLRTALALPIADWGLAFKPDQWLYPFVNAAYAFSFQHLVYIAAFLAGYALLFVRLGITAGTGALLALALFFTAFVQFWWTTFASDLAYFPWVLLALGIRRTALRAVGFLWIAVVWMLGYFYPPIFIALALAAAAVYWSVYLPERWPRGAAVDIVVALAACAVVVFYLQDYFAATWNSIYPGQRSLKGGAISLAMQMQHLWPTAFLRGYETTIPKRNVCDASVVGSYYFLLAACFVDWQGFRVSALPAATRRVLVAAAAVFALLFAWQSLSIPATVGRWLLFDRILPQRTLFASGFLAFVTLALVVEARGLRFSLMRLAVFCVVGIAGWWLAQGSDAEKSAGVAEALLIPVTLAAYVVGARYPAAGRAALAGAAALLGLVAFAPFNPLQSAWPIFNRETTPVTRALDAEQARHPRSVLVSNPFGSAVNGWGQGATLNGLGYRSASHVLLAPELALWQRLLPDMDAVGRETVFNRTAEIVVRDVDAPELLAINVVAVPPRVFGSDARPWFSVAPLETVAWQMRGGHVDTRFAKGRRLDLGGWTPWHGLAPGQTLALHSPLALRVVSTRRYERPDVAAVLRDPGLRYSGFAIEVERTDGAEIPADLPVCLVARDLLAGTTTLVEPGAPACVPTKG